MFGAGLAHWHTVSRVLRLHWYYVTVQHELEGRQVEYELMINDEHQLEAVLNSKDPTMVVISAQVVIPAYMNGGGIPSMEPLTRVSVGRTSSSVSFALSKLKAVPCTTIRIVKISTEHW